MRWTGFVVGLALASLTSCSSMLAPGPRVPANSTFYEQVTTIAVAPVRGPRELDLGVERQKQFLEPIEESLRSAGFRVLDDRSVMECFAAAMKHNGPYIDPYTGAHDDAKERAIWRDTLEAVVTFKGADAVLIPTLEPTSATFSGDTASWDGASEFIEARDQFVRAREHQPYAEGTVAALSLVVQVVGADGKPRYEHRGGVQLLGKQQGWTLVKVPPDQWLAKAERARKAVEIALEPLISGRPKR